jgi:hypothetical protein
MAWDRVTLSELNWALAAGACVGMMPMRLNAKVSTTPSSATSTTRMGSRKKGNCARRPCLPITVLRSAWCTFTNVVSDSTTSFASSSDSGDSFFAAARESNRALISVIFSTMAPNPCAISGAFTGALKMVMSSTTFRKLSDIVVTSSNAFWILSTGVGSSATSGRAPVTPSWHTASANNTKHNTPLDAISPKVHPTCSKSTIHRQNQFRRSN